MNIFGRKKSDYEYVLIARYRGWDRYEKELCRSTNLRKIIKQFLEQLKLFNNGVDLPSPCIHICKNKNVIGKYANTECDKNEIFDSINSIHERN